MDNLLHSSTSEDEEKLDPAKMMDILDDRINVLLSKFDNQKSTIAELKEQNQYLSQRNQELEQSYLKTLEKINSYIGDLEDIKSNYEKYNNNPKS
ncbi:MAG: hypothetical protein AB8B67_03540 [Rickettsiaceae bacterium]